MPLNKQDGERRSVNFANMRQDKIKRAVELGLPRSKAKDCKGRQEVAQAAEETARIEAREMTRRVARATRGDSLPTTKRPRIKGSFRASQGQGTDLLS